MKHGTEETHECLYGLANVAKDLLCGYGTEDERKKALFWATIWGMS